MVTCCDHFPPRCPHSVLQRPSRLCPTKLISSERKIPTPIQYNQVIPSDHLADQDPPPAQTGFSLFRRLTVKVARNKGPPTSLSEAFLWEECYSMLKLEKSQYQNSMFQLNYTRYEK